MATDRQASRLALEAIAITLSILAAFAIDAWWEGRGQRQEELQIVGTLLDEMTTNRERLAEKREWQAGLEEATNTLLAVGDKDVVHTRASRRLKGVTLPMPL